MDYLVSYLIKLLNLENLVVIFDGERSAQKLDTATKRLEKLKQSTTNFSNDLDKADERDKLSKNHWRRLEKDEVAASFIPKDIMERIYQELDDAGVSVVRATYEADIYIGKKQDATVISADGDFYCHKNIQVIYFNSSRYMENLYSTIIPKLLKLLRLKKTIA